MHSIPRLIAAVAVAAGCSASAYAADVGVSVNVGEPGFFGSLDIGGYPPPQTVYAQPVIIDRGPGYDAQPLYLRVPVGYESDWRRHCREYNACGRPVYFVRDDWYRNVYAPHYRDYHARDEHRDRPQYDQRRGDERRGDERRGDDRRGRDEREEHHDER